MSDRYSFVIRDSKWEIVCYWGIKATDFMIVNCDSYQQTNKTFTHGKRIAFGVFIMLIIVRFMNNFSILHNYERTCFQSNQLFFRRLINIQKRAFYLPLFGWISVIRHDNRKNN